MNRNLPEKGVRQPVCSWLQTVYIPIAREKTAAAWTYKNLLLIVQASSAFGLDVNCVAEHCH